MTSSFGHALAASGQSSFHSNCTLSAVAVIVARLAVCVVVSIATVE